MKPVLYGLAGIVLDLLVVLPGAAHAASVTKMLHGVHICAGIHFNASEVYCMQDDRQMSYAHLGDAQVSFGMPHGNFTSVKIIIRVSRIDENGVEMPLNHGYINAPLTTGHASFSLKDIFSSLGVSGPGLYRIEVDDGATILGSRVFGFVALPGPTVHHVRPANARIAVKQMFTALSPWTRCSAAINNSMQDMKNNVSRSQLTQDAMQSQSICIDSVHALSAYSLPTVLQPYPKLHRLLFLMRQSDSLGVTITQGLYDLAQNQATPDENSRTASSYEAMLKDGSEIYGIMQWITKTWGQV